MENRQFPISQTCTDQQRNMLSAVAVASRTGKLSCHVAIRLRARIRRQTRSLSSDQWFELVCTLQTSAALDHQGMHDEAVKVCPLCQGMNSMKYQMPSFPGSVDASPTAACTRQLSCCKASSLMSIYQHISKCENGFVKTAIAFMNFILRKWGFVS